MHASDLATWATIIGPLLALVTIFIAVAPALSPHQRNLRAKLREALRPLLKDTSVGTLRASLESLIAIRDEGLLAPSPSQIEYLLSAIRDALATDGKKLFTDVQPVELVRAIQAGTYISHVAGDYIRATVRMDNGNMIIYYSYRRATHPLANQSIYSPGRK